MATCNVSENLQIQPKFIKLLPNYLLNGPHKTASVEHLCKFTSVTADVKQTPISLGFVFYSSRAHRQLKEEEDRCEQELVTDALNLFAIGDRLRNVHVRSVRLCKCSFSDHCQPCLSL